MGVEVQGCQTVWLLLSMQKIAQGPPKCSDHLFRDKSTSFFSEWGSIIRNSGASLFCLWKLRRLQSSCALADATKNRSLPKEISLQNPPQGRTAATSTEIDDGEMTQGGGMEC